jgi:hypothetical protein
VNGEPDPHRGFPRSPRARTGRRSSGITRMRWARRFRERGWDGRRQRGPVHDRRRNVRPHDGTAVEDGESFPQLRGKACGRRPSRVHIGESGEPPLPVQDGCDRIQDAAVLTWGLAVHGRPDTTTSTGPSTNSARYSAGRLTIDTGPSGSGG